MMVQIEIDEGTRGRLEVLAREIGLPVCDVVRTLGYASREDLRRLDVRRVMAEERERTGQPRPAAIGIAGSPAYGQNAPSGRQNPPPEVLGAA